MKPLPAIALGFVAVMGVIWGIAALRMGRTQEDLPPPAIKPAVVRASALQEREYAVTESFWGLLEARAQVDMAFQIAGRISSLGDDAGNPIAENQKVMRGDVIARVEPLRYEAVLEQAKAAMLEARATMATAQAQVDKAQARAEDAQHELARLQKLQRGGAAHQREIELAELRVTLSKANIDEADAQRASAQAAYASARATMTVAEVNLQDSVLKAPMKATVAAIPVEIGQMVQPGEPVVSLVDLSKVRLVVGVVERKLPLLREGQKVTVEIQALMSQAALLSDSQVISKPRDGVITVVPPAADPKTGLFNVEIELPNEYNLLFPGMVGRAKVTVHEKQAIAIPADAAMRSGGYASAYFVSEGFRVGLDLGPLGRAALDVPAPVAKRVRFKPSAVDKDHYLIDDPPQGLSQLIVEGQNRLSDGQTITIVSPLASAPATADAY